MEDREVPQIAPDGDGRTLRARGRIEDDERAHAHVKRIQLSSVGADRHAPELLIGENADTPMEIAGVNQGDALPT